MVRAGGIDIQVTSGNTGLLTSACIVCCWSKPGYRTGTKRSLYPNPSLAGRQAASQNYSPSRDAPTRRRLDIHVDTARQMSRLTRPDNKSRPHFHAKKQQVEQGAPRLTLIRASWINHRMQVHIYIFICILQCYLPHHVSETRDYVNIQVLV